MDDPQGSILGPFLFLIYIKDLLYFIRDDHETVLFADDTSLLFKIKRGLPLNYDVNNSIARVVHWFNWGPHIDKLSRRLRSAAYAVMKIRRVTDIDTARLVYFSAQRVEAAVPGPGVVVAAGGPHARRDGRLPARPGAAGARHAAGRLRRDRARAARLRLRRPQPGRLARARRAGRVRSRLGAADGLVLGGGGQLHGRGARAPAAVQHRLQPAAARRLPGTALHHTAPHCTTLYHTMLRHETFMRSCSQELTPRYQITPAAAFGALPTAHTCFNQLCLPDYDDYEHLVRALLWAINEGGEGFGMI
ncbi:unnamed protein product [Diatraea saccharalis]|uniref:HECT-type E3 ubiquitin transferase n=1 Tax=Diatraea saccharalis TaxID=40085 RepID=A0A9N9QYL5_9NEOP|nr:unnamed protein product [Diatraea saccharalis]